MFHTADVPVVQITQLRGVYAQNCGDLLTITFEHPDHPVKIVQIPDEQTPSFRSSIVELRQELADRISARYQFEREPSFTKAIIALGAFAAGLNVVVPNGDPGFGPRAHLWPEDVTPK